MKRLSVSRRPRCLIAVVTLAAFWVGAAAPIYHGF